MDILIGKFKSNATLYASVQNCEKEATPILQNFITNFPDFTDHSINHSKSVLNYASFLVSNDLKKINEDEAYILVMAGFLHDIGMCPTPKMKKEIKESSEFKESGKKFEDHLRDIHHEVSYNYIMTHWKKLKIVSEPYAEAIALVGMGHRVVELNDFERYNPEYSVKSGTDYVCLPYLASILRLADELDITNDRTPELLFDEYLPDNKISKKEWDKHKANYFVNFKNDSIKITSKCYEKDLYYALLKQYGKIEDVLKYVQKVMYSIPHNDRKLGMQYNRLEKDIKIVGFIPKEIKFSFDLQNTINTFIGKNIYNNKYIALREALQNSIDTCRCKMSMFNTNYKPQIKVTVEDDRISIWDNGIGMDDFIVENYFARLTKSYYSEKQQDFESIGQFGVGVFSYFLLCDFFEVETQMEGKQSLKFRVNKNADSFFHFYDQPTFTGPGTKLTLFIKEKISFEKVFETLKHHLRHIEFSIEVISNDISEFIIAKEFKIDKSVLVNEIEDRYIKNINRVSTIDVYINNDDFEGIIGFTIYIDNDGVYVPVNGYEYFGTNYISEIDLSQKGIFIESIVMRSLQPNLGSINLKKRNQINLSRNRIDDVETTKLSESFFLVILRELFDNWKNLGLIKRNRLTVELISNNIQFWDDKHLWNYFANDFVFTVFNNKKYEIYTLQEILKIDKIVLFKKNTYQIANEDVENEEATLKRIHKTLKYCIIPDNLATTDFIFNFLSYKSYSHRVVSHKYGWYYIFDTQNVHSHDVPAKFKASSITNLCQFDQPHIAALPGLKTSVCFNSDHPIIQYYFNNYIVTLDDNGVFDLFELFFDSISDLLGNFYNDMSGILDSKELNFDFAYSKSVLDKINLALTTNFTLTITDFPKVISDEIKWGIKKSS